MFIFIVPTLEIEFGESMLSFLWGLAQGTLGVPLTSPYIGKWSGAAYTLYTFRTGQDYFVDLQLVE